MRGGGGAYAMLDAPLIWEVLVCILRWYLVYIHVTKKLQYTVIPNVLLLCITIQDNRSVSITHSINWFSTNGCRRKVECYSDVLAKFLRAQIVPGESQIKPLSNKLFPFLPFCFSLIVQVVLLLFHAELYLRHKLFETSLSGYRSSRWQLKYPEIHNYV